MSVLSKFIGGAGALTVQGVVQRLIGVLTSIVLARGLGATGFGTYSAVINTAGTAYAMVRLGIDAAILVYAAKGGEDEEARRRTGALLSAALGLLAMAGIVAAIASVALAEWAAVVIFGQADLVVPLKFAGLLTALQCLSQFSYAILAGLQRFHVYARLMILNAVLTLALCAAGMWIYGLAGALIGYGVAQATLTVSLGREAAIAIRRREIWFAASGIGRSIGTLLRLGMPFYVSGLVSVPVIFYLQGLLSRSAGIDSLAVLRIIGSITAIVAFVPGSVAAVTTSTLARVRAEGGVADPRVFAYAFLHLKVVLFLTTTIAVILAMLIPTLIEMLFGNEYRIAIEPGVVALFSTALASTGASAGSLFLAIERSGTIFWQSLWGTVVFVGAGLLLIPWAGVLGYVSAELAANSVVLVFTVYSAFRLAGPEQHSSRLVEAFAICAIAGALAIMAIFQIEGNTSRILAVLFIVLLMGLSVLRYGLSEWERSIVSRLILNFRIGRG